jgi:Ca-activated chloride channel family protein
MRYIFLAALIILGSLLAFKPLTPFTVHGKVTDASGTPIPGVTVMEKNRSTGTTTDANGEFTLTVSSENAKLVFTSVGFDLKEIAVKGKTGLTIKMKASENRLDEVVVTGYGTVRKRDMTGAVSSIRSEDFSGIPAPSYYHQQEAGRQPAKLRVRADKEQERKSFYGNNYADSAAAFNTEDYDAIVENRFLDVKQNALSTFSIDVDAASYSNLRRYLQMGQIPPAGAVRIEEMINYFHYEYPQPKGVDPFSINTEMAPCPWNSNHQLVLIGLQGKKIPVENLPASNLVFLIDVSGSMQEENKLPLVQASMKLLVDQLREQDKVSIVVYAGNAGLVLAPTSGNNKTKIKEAIDALEAGGSTAGGAGIQLAYKTAKQNLVKNGNNRVILCTDGDFNVGASSDDALVQMIEEERKSGVFLTVLGYGMGNYKDNKMEKLADKGNGNHAYIDGIAEARKVLVNEFGGTLFTIAKDVKLQVEFNPAKVQAYRLIGYENRLLNKEDFNNDKKDAGELGSGHTVTALYEVIPTGAKNEFAEKVDALKYQQAPEFKPVNSSNEVLTVKFRYKQPDGETSKLIEHAVTENFISAEHASANFRFAAAVAEFGMLLLNSEFRQEGSYNKVWQLAKSALGNDEEGYRSEFLKLVKNASSIAKAQTKKPVPDEDDENDEDVSIQRR